MRWLFEALHCHYGPQAWWPARDSFEVMVGALLVQQTAWSNVERAIAALRREDSLEATAIAAMPLERLQTLIRPAGFYRMKARRLRSLAGFVVKSGGVAGLTAQSSAELRAALLSLEGIGDETADAILLYAFERPAGVIDAYTRRLLARLNGQASGDRELREAMLEAIPSAPELNELHALIVEHGKRHCRKQPVCEGCCLRARCAQG